MVGRGWVQNMERHTLGTEGWAGLSRGNGRQDGCCAAVPLSPILACRIVPFRGDLLANISASRILNSPRHILSGFVPLTG
jgi:hypothetical protein